MAVNVVWNYGGNVTGLFYTGSANPLPPELEAEPTWRVSDAKGYDAQFYHLIAHDPLIRRGWEAWVDNPSLRWRRIGVPALASLFGPAVHEGFVLIQLAFVFLGAWWLSLYSQRTGLPAVLGLGFVLIPATLVSIDRMTIDLALAALVIGFVYFEAGWPVYAILCVAPLVRETGMILVGGWVLWNAVQGRWRQSLLGAACGTPALGWWLYVQARTAPDATPWLARHPFSSLVDRTLTGIPMPTDSTWLRLANITEQLVVAGLWLAFGLVVWRLSKRRFDLIEITAALFVLFASLLGKADIWEDAYAAGRTMSPLLVFLVLLAIRDRRFLFITPILLILPRIALQFEAQLAMALRATRSGS
jgi:hypothetical protein